MAHISRSAWEMLSENNTEPCSRRHSLKCKTALVAATFHLPLRSKGSSHGGLVVLVLIKGFLDPEPSPGVPSTILFFFCGSVRWQTELGFSKTKVAQFRRELWGQYRASSKKEEKNKE